jgi:hypothetical protein
MADRDGILKVVQDLGLAEVNFISLAGKMSANRAIL